MYLEENIQKNTEILNKIYNILVEKEDDDFNKNFEKKIQIDPNKRYHIGFISEFLEMSMKEIKQKILPINLARPNYFSGKSIISLMANETLEISTKIQNTCPSKLLRQNEKPKKDSKKTEDKNLMSKFEKLVQLNHVS